MNGKTAGIPNIYVIGIIIGFVFLIYLYISKKPGVKEFHPMDMKKETKRRIKKDYKYFGTGLNKNIYDAAGKKPIAYAIGIMKITEMQEMKRYEPVYSKFSTETLALKHEKIAQEVYTKPYSQLTELEKKNADEAAKEELRNERVDVMMKDEKTKIVRGRKEINYSIPTPMFAFKVCSPSLIAEMLARYLGVGIDWWAFDKEQIRFDDKGVTLTGNFQRRQANDIFIFSNAGKNLVQDITFGVERENIWQETANQIPRAVHFDTEASKALIYRREDARIEKDKHKAQTESHEFG